MKKRLLVVFYSMILAITSTLVSCKEPDAKSSGSEETGVTETSEPFTELKAEEEVEIELGENEDTDGL